MWIFPPICLVIIDDQANEAVIWHNTRVPSLKHNFLLMKPKEYSIESIIQANVINLQKIRPKTSY